MMAHANRLATNLPAAVARAQFLPLVDRAAESGEPIRIIGVRNRAVLLSERDWNSIQETLHLLSTPGMRESIRKGLKTPVGKCASRAGW